MGRHLNRAEPSHEQRDGDERHEFELDLETDRRAQAHRSPQGLQTEDGAIDSTEQGRQFAPRRDQ